MKTKDLNQPSSYPRRVLLAVTGLSPQIVTETVYALARTITPAFIPTEIFLVTTAEGAERARLTLLSDDPGWFHRLRRDYDLPEIAFDAGRIRVIPDASGTAMADIRSLKDNEAAADFLTELVRTLTADDDTALHVSIAGGRKTMGFYAGYALSLFGRPQDRLSHALVSPPFESNQTFFYPTPYSRVIYTHPPENRPVDARDAAIMLADIPFVRLRDELPRRLLEGKASFTQTVAAANRASLPPRLVIDRKARALEAAGEIVRLSPAEFAFYLWMAQRRCEGKPPVHWTDGEISAEFLDVYRFVRDAMSADYERAAALLADGMTKEYFEQHKSRTNGTLKDTLGERAAQPYVIASEGARPRTRFGLRLPADAIHFERLDEDDENE